MRRQVLRNAIQNEKVLLDVMEMYDMIKSLKQNCDEFKGYKSDADEAESDSVVIGMLNTKREQMLESCMSLP